VLTPVRIASGRSWSVLVGTPLSESGDRIGRAAGRDFLSPFVGAAPVMAVVTGGLLLFFSRNGWFD
jgi:hypothetical protein